jgi:hypothetical protein
MTPNFSDKGFVLCPLDEIIILCALQGMLHGGGKFLDFLPLQASWEPFDLNLLSSRV